MSTHDSSQPAQAHRFATSIALINTIAVTVLIGSEAFFFALSLDWSLAGILHIGPLIYLPLGAALSAIALWATISVFCKAWRAERLITERGDQAT